MSGDGDQLRGYVLLGAAEGTLTHSLGEERERTKKRKPKQNEECEVR